jgi:hypothetical protein
MSDEHDNHTLTRAELTLLLLVGAAVWALLWALVWLLIYGEL